MDLYDLYLIGLEKVAKKLDPVGKEDADMDNDGDVDKSDAYLLNRRAAVGKAMAKKKGLKKEAGRGRAAAGAALGAGLMGTHHSQNSYYEAPHPQMAAASGTGGALGAAKGGRKGAAIGGALGSMGGAELAKLLNRRGRLGRGLSNQQAGVLGSMGGAALGAAVGHGKKKKKNEEDSKG